MTRTAIVGAGIVGMCCAISLADRGHAVTLIDRGAPGRETSRWNAGVLATSSVIPLGTPAIFGKLPGLLAGRNPGFRLNPRAALPLLPWALRFLNAARAQRSERTIAALTDLIRHSRQGHDALCARAEHDCIRDGGWIIAYRGSDGMRRATAHAQSLEARGVAAQVLDTAGITALEPALAPIFGGAVHVTGAGYAIPVDLVAAYLDLARARGVEVQQAHVQGVEASGDGLRLNGTVGQWDNVVLACGAWTNDLLATCARPLPMAVERGYLQRFETEQKPTRPFFDVDGGYVAAPRPDGVQISSGTELTQLQTAPDARQLMCAVAKARDVLNLGAVVHADVAVGNRPTLPDNLPAIGPVPAVPGLWLAAGHQHVGFSTSAGTGDLLAQLMTGGPPPFDPTPFRTDRFED